jgi:hypothetical protein
MLAALRLITSSNKAPESFRADTGSPLQKVGSMLQALPVELAIAQEVLFSQHSLAIDDDVRSIKPVCQVQVSTAR